MSRRAILDKIRQSLNATPNDQARRSALDARIANPPRAPAPSRVAATGSDTIACFKSELEKQLATVVEIDNPALIPSAIASYLEANKLPLRLRHGCDPYLSQINWTSAAGLTLNSGPAAPNDPTGLSVAFAGVAETGTMVLQSGPDNPVTLGYLPDTHIIIVPKSRILATYEDAFERLRTAIGSGNMPRTLNWISGPSRTADIGGRIVIGAHGPRRLLALITAEK
ncbi:MAG: LUD domain-containing protein [Alphaproteobacteria bacterium]|nr:LUD domain-containing protein [Alphaproteobacteria bacterium]